MRLKNKQIDSKLDLYIMEKMNNWISDEEFDFKVFLEIVYPNAEKFELEKMYAWCPNKTMEENFDNEISELQKTLGVKKFEEVIWSIEKIFKN